MTEQREALRELAPSAKLVHRVLDDADDPLTESDIIEESLLPARTVRYAVSHLEEAELVECRPNPGDARQRLYSITEPANNR